MTRKVDANPNLTSGEVQARPHQDVGMQARPNRDVYNSMYVVR